MQNMSPSTYARGGPLSASAALPFLRKVYLFLMLGAASATVAAVVALYAGTPVPLDVGGNVVLASPGVAFGLAHPFVMLLGFIGSFFAATYARRIPGFGLAGLLGFTFMAGLLLAPTLFRVQLASSQGLTLDPSPIRDAFLLTFAAFGGLSGYALVTRKDFSFLGAALSMGLWVVIGASILGMFVGSAAFSLAVSSVAVLVFGGYILYDTSRLLRGGAGSDAVGAALGMFLNVFNLFLSLLNILSSRRQ